MDKMEKSASEIVETVITKLHKIYRKLTLITLIVAVVSSLSYLATYSFLYGYYFGGEFDSSFSNLEVLTRIIPFHQKTLAFTWFILALSISLIMYALKFAMEKKLLNTFVVLLILTVFHVLMTMFFYQNINLKNNLYFLIVLIFPIILSLMILFPIIGSRTPLKSIAGGFSGVILFIFIVVFFSNNAKRELDNYFSKFRIFHFRSIILLNPL